MSKDEPRDTLGRRRPKYRSPEVWAQVRERYLAGVPAPQLAVEYDVGLGNIRYRAQSEGWTRKHRARLEALPNVRWMTRRSGEPVLTAHQRALQDFITAWPEVWEDLTRGLDEIAAEALRDRPGDIWPYGDWALRWRAETFGPECAAADRERMAARAAVGMYSPPGAAGDVQEG